MRPIDADALMDDIKRDSKKAIEEGDKVGSFWLGYVAGLAIKQPTIQPHLIAKIQNGIKATNTNDVYSCGMRNGMRWCISLIDDKEPLYENCPSAQPERKTGRWIHREDMDFLDENKVEHIHLMCSECGLIHDFLDGHTSQYNYCPQCGAEMMEVEHE